MITTVYFNAVKNVKITAGQVDENGKILSAILKSDCGVFTGTVNTMINENGTTYRSMSPKGEQFWKNGDDAVINAAWAISDKVSSN